MNPGDEAVGAAPKSGRRLDGSAASDAVDHHGLEIDDGGPVLCGCGHRVFQHWHTDRDVHAEGFGPCDEPGCDCLTLHTASGRPVVVTNRAGVQTVAALGGGPVRRSRRPRVPVSHACLIPAVDRSPNPPDRNGWECGICGRKFRYSVHIPRSRDEIYEDQVRHPMESIAVVTSGWVEIKGPVR